MAVRAAAETVYFIVMTGKYRKQKKNVLVYERERAKDGGKSEGNIALRCEIRTEPGKEWGKKKE